jgi:exoribonuclease R
MYYPEHTIGTNIGLFTYLKPLSPTIVDGDNVYSVSNKSTNRAVEGDIVYYEPNDGKAIVIGIHKRNIEKTRIVGVLQITSTKSFGNTNRGLPIYNFIPLSWKYPNFMVPSSVRQKWKEPGPIKNVYIIIEFAEWTTKQKYPLGRCINVLGSIADMSAQELALLHKNQLNVKKYNSRRILDQFKPEPESIDESRIQHCTETILAIDPPGAKDLDDAFHIDEEYIYVHIADPDSLFTKNGELESEIMSRVTSIYAKDTVYNMLPPEFSEKYLSLNTTETKSTVTIVLDHMLNGIKHYISRIKVTKCLTYDDAQLCLNKNTGLGKIITELSNITGKKDTHEMIEKIMISANKYVGETTSKKLTLLRTMDKIPKAEHEGLLEYLKFKNVQGAKYIVYQPNKNLESTHGGLGIDKYVHFTSPIRRYADLLIHRLLKDPDSYQAEELQKIADHINAYNLKVKRYYRDSQTLDLSHKLDQLKPVNTTGYIVDYNVETTNISVYLPAYDIEYRYALISDNLADIIHVTHESDYLEITNVHKQETYKVEKFTELDVLLSVNPESVRLNKRITMRLDGFSEIFF